MTYDLRNSNDEIVEANIDKSAVGELLTLGLIEESSDSSAEQPIYQVSAAGQEYFKKHVAQ